MSPGTRIWLVLTLLFTLCSFLARAENSPLATIISGYEKNGIAIGVAVHDVKDKAELFSHNAHKPFNPASTMKVVTSAAALIHLGGAYEYKTVVTTDRLAKGVLSNIYLKGSGDPSLVEERLWRIAKDLQVRGVKAIEGDIVVDNSYFDDFDFQGQEEGSSRAYNASLSALAVNFNSFAVVANNAGGGDLDVHIDPPIPYFNLKSNVRPAGNSLSIERSFSNGVENVTANGGVTTEKIKYANVENPVQYAGATFKWVLEQVGISVSGKIRAGVASGTKKIFTDRSKPLCLIIRDLNKFSNNFTAEMILKTLGAVKSGVPGSTEKGVTVLKGLVAGLGVPESEYAIFNGSGLSRKNRVSPNTLNQVLMAVYKNNKIRSDFMASLAIAGTDGTLASRFKSEGIVGNVKAKTGTLNDVTSLSGYLETSSKKILAFTIMVNGAGAGSGGFISMQERLLLEMYRGF